MVEKIVGHGVDLIEIARVSARLKLGAGDFLGSFTAREAALEPPGPGQAPFLGGRLAAKEAVAKALGTGFSQGVTWLDVEILRDDSGAPCVELHGRASERARALGVTRWWVSISHSETHAVASVIAVGHAS